jgi:hypothetical protein
VIPFESFVVWIFLPQRNTKVKSKVTQREEVKANCFFHSPSFTNILEKIMKTSTNPPLGGQEGRIIFLNYRLLIALLILIVIIVLMPVCFPSVSHSVYMKTGVQPAKYYTLISLTLVALIPVLIGIAYGRLTADETQPSAIKSSIKGSGMITDSTYFRIFISIIISFILIILSILLIKPVPSQGWLRTLYAAMLLSVHAPFVLLLVGITGNKKIASPGLTKLYWIIFLALPLGLLVHHPWNYFAFFSPFYWIAWAWMINPVVESVLCGSIAIILSSSFLFILLRYYQKKLST